MAEFTRRQRNIVQKLLNGEGYWSKSEMGPYMSRKEYNVLVGDYGLPIQCQSAWGADRSGGLLYTGMDGLKEKAEAIGLLPKEAPPNAND